MNACRSYRPLRSGLFRSQTRSIGAQVIMLVTFSCKAYPNITMFGDVAVRLLTMMGHSGTVPSAILAADIPAAVAKLEARVAAEGKSPAPGEASSANDDEPAVSLAQRAMPLIELFNTAASAGCDVMWDKDR